MSTNPTSLDLIITAIVWNILQILTAMILLAAVFPE